MDDPELDARKSVVTKSPPKKKKAAAATRPSPPPKKNTDTKLLGDLAAAQKAIRDQSSVATGHTFQVALSRIVANHNYRNEPANLAALGYSLINKDDPEHSLVDMCLSDDMDTVRQVVALFEAHEGIGEEEDTDAKVADRNTSIVSLANKFEKVGQLQPICVRKLTGENRALIFGQRRVAAKCYLHARSRCEVEDGVEGAKVIPATVKAIVADVPPERAWMMAVAENADRKDDDPIQEGMLYDKLMKMVDPETERKYTLTKAAELMKVNKSRVRSYQALVQPRDETKKRGLTDEDREAIRTKRKTVTWGIRRALGERHYSQTGNRQANRGKAIPLAAMQNLFDDTAEANYERRKAIAECMGFPATDEGLAEAVAQSETRIADQESKRVRPKDDTEEDELSEE